MKRIIFILLILYTAISFAQGDRETRAVWLTTNFRLDWPPPTFDEEKQKQALIEILDDIKAQNLNTIFFQVRTNGVVFFNSSFEPLTDYITGEVDGSASYDPLEFAVEQAHKRGLEIHAWVNVVRVYAGSESSILKNPRHIFQKKPEWIITDIRDGQKSLWLDPGLPEVREYLSDLFLEMCEKYDIDGIHFDFIRYPGKNFEDDFSYNIYGGGYSRDDWRRNNITELISLTHSKIKSYKPFMKIGAAPIGIFKNLKGMRGWEGYYEVYQDSREWLKRGIVDYVAPQIYWGFDENARFDLLAQEWVQNSYGRNVVLGIAAYKENVKKQIESMINLGRTINASGVAFFRYESIKKQRFESFENKTYPASMAWLDRIYPEAPKSLVYKTYEDNKNHFLLSWDENPEYDEDIKYVAVYNLPNQGSEILSEYLFEIVPADKKNLSLAIDRPKKINYYFTLKSVSKLWNESIESSNVIEIKFPEMDLMAKVADYFENPVLVKSDNYTKLLLFSKQKDKAELYGSTDDKSELIKVLQLFPGKNVIEIENNITGYKSLKYVCKTNAKEFEIKLR